MKISVPFTAGLFTLAVLCITGFSRCNKPVLYQEEIASDTSLVGLTQKKVLFITIQGARGDVMETANIPNIQSLQAHSIYSWNAVCDTVST